MSNIRKLLILTFYVHDKCILVTTTGAAARQLITLFSDNSVQYKHFSMQVLIENIFTKNNEKINRLFKRIQFMLLLKKNEVTCIYIMNCILHNTLYNMRY